jgi:hypothetical protein
MRPSYLNCPQHTLPQWLTQRQKPLKIHALLLQRSRLYKRLRKSVGVLLLLIVIALSLSLSGCATRQQTPPPVHVVIPPAPSLSQPLPSQTYSDSVRDFLSKSQQRLMDMLQTQ